MAYSTTSWRLLVCSLSLCLLPLVASQLTHPSEVEALNSIAKHWDLGKWSFSVDPCTINSPWSFPNNPGIGCDCSSFGNSTCHVTHMNLAQNILNGSIPPQFGQLSKMRYLSLGINNFTGPVPAELGNLTSLISLSFSSNNLSGPLPKELGNLTPLEQLYIDSSGMSGNIPKELVNLKALRILWASDNLFTGNLPEFFGTLTNLENLRLEGTSLNGPIPTNFAALTKLTDLRLGGPMLGKSSLSFVKNLRSLSILSLRNCQISGELPVQLGDFPNLLYLDLSFNKLTGQIPSSFQNLKSLEILYLGNNNLSGPFSSQIMPPKLMALDLSFNQLWGTYLSNDIQSGLVVNLVGTRVDVNTLYDRCDTRNCIIQTSATGIVYSDDSETLGSASFYTSTEQVWSVSNTGIFISNPNGPKFIASTDSQIMGTLESELYKTARISQSSLRYYGTSLINGKYYVELHFAEIVMDDSVSWKGLGRRIFDVYIQGERVLKDFDIKAEAKGAYRAIVKTFDANVTNNVLEIHFFWAGKGTCCIPFQGTYGPLVSAMRIYQQGSTSASFSSRNDKRRRGVLLGLVLGGAGGLLIASSIVYLWRKKDENRHFKVHTDSPRKV
ncbi:hypothetical protein AMTRI_Chr13g121250 [Amborella trichopoda]